MFNNDAALGVSINSVSVKECSKSTTANAIFIVSLSGLPVSVKYVTTNGAALSDADYTLVAMTILSSASGETNKTIAVSAIGDDIVELNEEFQLVVSNPASAKIIVGKESLRLSIWTRR
ncbi:MAG: hypothetical protein EOP04_07305 [Proteobacteria bacterium]|nr:MAG: hypothetical protein EOP04_07305 [Pseudomonadota bacterium]